LFKILVGDPATGCMRKEGDKLLLSQWVHHTSGPCDL
jgi:hypothetical protein